MQPLRIILFGSRARGTARSDSDYDVMVEVDYEDRHACLVELGRAVGDGEAGVSVDIVLRKPGALQRDQDDLGFVDWDIAREGIVIYPTDAPPLPQLSSRPRPRRVSGKPPPASVLGCERLKDYAVDVRYPELVPILEEVQGRAAREAGDRIVAAARVHLKPLGVR